MKRRKSSSAPAASLARCGSSTLPPTTSRSSASPGPWSQRLPHFRLDSTPSNGDEIQSEYFVDRRHGAAALEARAAAVRSSITPLLMISEIRSTAADGLWLSGSYGRDTLAIHFTWRNRPDQVDAVLKHVEAALEPFARPAALGQGLPRHGRPRWQSSTRGSATRETCSNGSTPTAGSATTAWSAWASARRAEAGRYLQVTAPWLLEPPEQLRADLVRVRPAQAVAGALDGDVLAAADEFVRARAAGVDGQDAVRRAVQDQDRDVDLPQVVAEVLVPRGHAGDRPLGEAPTAVFHASCTTSALIRLPSVSSRLKKFLFHSVK